MRWAFCEPEAELRDGEQVKGIDKSNYDFPRILKTLIEPAYAPVVCKTVEGTTHAGQAEAESALDRAGKSLGTIVGIPKAAEHFY